MTYKSGCKNYALLTPNRRHLSKSIARGHKRGLVDHCFCDPETQRYIMNKLNRQVRGEVKNVKKGGSFKLHAVCKVFCFHGKE